MEYREIIVDSFIGKQIVMELAMNDSDTLMVLLPGADYNIWGPSFYYSYSMGIELELDVLSVIYGFEKEQLKFTYDYLDSIVSETLQAINSAISEGGYNRLIFVARSLGTLVMSKILPEYDNFNSILIYHSPIKSVINCICENAGFVVVGSNDPILKSISIDELSMLDNVELQIVEDGDHSLDVGQFEDSIDAMKDILIGTRKYIISMK